MELPGIFKKVFGNAIKKAEKTLNNNKQLEKLLDKAFEKIGDSSKIFYEVQYKLAAMIRLIKNFAARKYTDVSYKTIVIAVASIIYLVNPLDFIPDFLPVSGLLDDLTIITYVLALINEEIDKFIEWESERAKEV